ncbi:unnamed protein product [Vitrella brassicaformis CCMP3155]|uniref:RING-type E3 ubiquitin transferase n=1 Tax=Vitrella brassicaformis (strain CCMP3155) TaxID=1169540 RepID=A0A0G4EH81_VITBC|nr:unnamed protein product [Vitrella brassicaformis CCMP3155]|eukprot:CEL94734.1 unnamed protein product [Vitrella brassicaformis CCMP3155]
MTVTVGSASACDKWQELTQKLNAKKTFISAVKALAEAVERGDTAASADQVHATIKRAFTVCQTRYISSAYWSPNLDLLLSYQFTLPLDDPRRREADLWVETAVREVSEGQERLQRKRDEMDRREAQRQAGTQAGEEATADGPGGGAMTDLLDMLRQRMEQVGLGMHQGAAPFIVGDAPDFSDSGPPPAARTARADLPMRKIQPFADGSMPTCAICHEEFVKGGKAKEMPCEHMFHYDCLLLWLERHNTCPMCRHSLPIDRQDFDEVAKRVQQRHASHSGLYA